MPYASRNKDGDITAISMEPTQQCRESIAPSHPDYIKFINQFRDQETSDERLSLIRSDLDFIRVMEDLIDTLVNKNIICITDLPEAVQFKLVKRRKMRAEFTQQKYTLDEDEPPI